MFSFCSGKAMDNRINEIRRKMSVLRVEMVRVEYAMHDQIKRDLDCTTSALRLMAMRRELAALVAEWKAAGGSDPLPTVQERLSANSRSAQKLKAGAPH
jgi:chorismate mutase